MVTKRMQHVRPRQNEDTLWRPPCVPRCCPSVAKRGNIVARWADTRKVRKFSGTLFCVQETKFVSATNVARVAKRAKTWETWLRQQCCRHNVSSFSWPLTCNNVPRCCTNMLHTFGQVFGSVELVFTHYFDNIGQLMLGFKHERGAVEAYLKSRRGRKCRCPKFARKVWA